MFWQNNILYKQIIFFSIILLFFVSKGYCQGNNNKGSKASNSGTQTKKKAPVQKKIYTKFIAKGQVLYQGNGLSGVKIEIKGFPRKKVVTARYDGGFEVRLDYLKEYQLIFFKKGFHNKIIHVSTQLNPDILDEEFDPYQFSIDLIPLDSSLGYDAGKPVAKIIYNSELDAFDFDKTYINKKP